MEITPNAESTKANDAKYNIISQRLELTLFIIWLTLMWRHPPTPTLNQRNQMSDTQNLNNAADGGLPRTPCSRLFRVQVTFDTVIYAEDEKAAKQKVKYGTGEIDDMPVSVLAMPIESSDGLPAGWNTGCLPWGDAPKNTTIGEIINANADVLAPAGEKTPTKKPTL